MNNHELALYSPHRMYGVNGTTIAPAVLGYQQVTELGQYLAYQWPGVATIKLTATYATAYDEDFVAYDSFTFEGLPGRLREAIQDLDLDGVELEFFEF